MNARSAAWPTTSLPNMRKLPSSAKSLTQPSKSPLSVRWQYSAMVKRIFSSAVIVAQKLDRNVDKLRAQKLAHTLAQIVEDGAAGSARTEIAAQHEEQTVQIAKLVPLDGHILAQGEQLRHLVLSQTRAEPMPGRRPPCPHAQI